MTVVLDTNVLIQIFGRRSPWRQLKESLLDGRVTLAVSTPVLLEYEEVVVRIADEARWRDIARLLELTELLHGNIRKVAPTYRFAVITGDPDDNAFADCAIVADADFVITEDRHFDELKRSGYKPQPITPEEFIKRLPVAS